MPKSKHSAIGTLKCDSSRAKMVRESTKKVVSDQHTQRVTEAGRR